MDGSSSSSGERTAWERNSKKPKQPSDRISAARRGLGGWHRKARPTAGSQSDPSGRLTRPTRGLGGYCRDYIPRATYDMQWLRSLYDTCHISGSRQQYGVVRLGTGDLRPARPPGVRARGSELTHSRHRISVPPDPQGSEGRGRGRPTHNATSPSRPTPRGRKGGKQARESSSRPTSRRGHTLHDKRRHARRSLLLARPVPSEGRNDHAGKWRRPRV